MNKKAHLRTLVAASMMSVGALLLVGALLYLVHPTPAQANSGDLNTALSQYPQLSNTRLNSCSLCHSSSIPSLNSYGVAFSSKGRNAAALKAIEALDSNGDGFSNIQEINALTFPGNANDKPAAAATATNTPTKAPTNTPTKAPTNIPTSAPTNTPTKAPTNIPTSAPTNTPTKVNTPTGVPPTSTPTRVSQPTNSPTVPAPSLTPTTPANTQPPYPPPTTATPIPTGKPSPTSQPKPTQKPTSNPGSGTLSVGSAADSYVIASLAKHNFGGAKELKVAQEPAARSYLRFDVKGLDGKKVSKAMLSLYVDSASGDGFDVVRVSDQGWEEGKITYRNAPKTGSRIASSGAASGQWVTIDVTALIHGSGRYSLALVAHKGSSISFASRETGSNAPQLKLTVAQRGDDDDHDGDDGGGEDHDD
jgi:hypothetical protein